MRDEFVLKQLLDGLEGLSSSQVTDTRNQLRGNVFVVTHSHLDGCKDTEFLSRNEVQILNKESHTEGSNLIFPFVEL